MTSTLVSVDNLKIAFRKNSVDTIAVRKLTFSIKEGETLAIVGESGSGKSVTTKLILGLLNQKNVRKKGQIIFNNKNILNLSQKEFKKIRGNDISIIFQDPIAALNPVFKIKDQFYEVNLNNKPLSKKESFLIASKALEKVSIRDPERVLESYPFQLSGGLAQRVIITMAMINKPELLLADEPIASLDPLNARLAMEALHSINKDDGITVICNLHTLDTARHYCDRIIGMKSGEIVFDGTPRKLTDNTARVVMTFIRSPLVT